MMTRSRYDPVPLLTAAALFALLAGSTWATTLVQMSLDEIVSRSAEIVHGRVVSTESEWNEDRTMIVTNVRVQIFDTLKGTAAGNVSFVHPGGVVGAMRVEIPGIGSFRAEQESVLFLRQGAAGARQIVGGIQGRFDVATDPETGAKTVRIPARVESTGQTGRRREESLVPAEVSTRAREVSLEEFSNRVRQLGEAPADSR